MIKIWEKISEEILFKNSWWEYKKDIFNIPGVKKGEYHYVHSRGASMTIPQTDDGKFILVNQYRYLNRKLSLEFPCGGVLQGDSYFETAKKELEEETGYTSSKIELIGEFNPYNGVTNEICKVYFASELIKCESKPDETEEFEIQFLSFDEIRHSINECRIWDGMTLASLVFLETFMRKIK